MNKTWLIAGLSLALCACGGSQKKEVQENPFFTTYTTPFGVPPFEDIQLEHYKEAFLKGMEEQKRKWKPLSISAPCPISTIPLPHLTKAEVC